MTKLTPNEYQRRALSTSLYEDKVSSIVGRSPYALQLLLHSTLALGLAGEAGEVAQLIKKRTRDDALPEDDVEAMGIPLDHLFDMQKELGDVLWYVAVLADAYGLKLDDIMQANLDKLQARKQAGTIGGSGDDR